MTVPVSSIRSSDQRVSSRRRRTLLRRRRTTLVVGLLVAAIAVALIAGAFSSSNKSGRTSSGTASAAANGTSRNGPVAEGRSQSASGKAPRHPAGVPAVEAGLLPWTTAQPISREVAVPTSATGVLTLGGLTSGDASVATATTLTVPAGNATPSGSLTTPTHDAAGAILRGRVLVFGGGAQTTVATVQAFPVTAAGGAVRATTVGQLPECLPAVSPSLLVVGIVAGIEENARDGVKNSEYLSKRSEEVLQLALQHPYHDL